MSLNGAKPIAVRQMSLTTDTDDDIFDSMNPSRFQPKLPSKPAPTVRAARKYAQLDDDFELPPMHASQPADSAKPSELPSMCCTHTCVRVYGGT